MKKHLVIAALIALSVMTAMVPAWSADTATDAAQVKRQSESMPTLRLSLASAAGYEIRLIELKHTAHLLTATVINSEKNSATSADRENEAIDMASAMERAMAGKPEFERVGAIRIDYITRTGKTVDTIQKFDFFRSPSKDFVLHKT